MWLSLLVPAACFDEGGEGDCQVLMGVLLCSKAPLFVVLEVLHCLVTPTLFVSGRIHGLHASDRGFRCWDIKTLFWLRHLSSLTAVTTRVCCRRECAAS